MYEIIWKYQRFKFFVLAQYFQILNSCDEFKSDILEVYFLYIIKVLFVI